MHHETQPSRDVLEQLARAREDLAAIERDRPGPAGRFPEGKLTPNDEGEIAFRIGALKGKVVLNFGVPVATICMSPSQARELARSLRKWADQAQHNKRLK